MTRANAQRGASLVSVLILIALMSSITVVFLHANRDRIKTTANSIARAQALSIAEGLIEQVLFELGPIEQRTDRPPPTPRPCVQSEWSAWIEIEDEAGKVDLNADDGEMLEALFTELNGEEEALAFRDLVLDFRDADDEPRAYGGEVETYEESGTEFGVRNAPFYAVDELYQLAFVSPHHVTKILPYVTVYNRSGGVQLSQALDAVRSASLRLETTGSATQTDLAISAGHIGQVYTIKVHVARLNSARVSLAAIANFSVPERAPIILEWNQVQVPDYINLDLEHDNKLPCIDLISGL